MLASWLGASEETADDRPVAWAKALTECDVWILSVWEADPLDHAATWNQQLNKVQFAPVRSSNAPIGNGNGSNNMIFSSSIFGQTFPTGVLAVTTNWLIPSTGQRVEADIVFNTAFGWNSRGKCLNAT